MIRSSALRRECVVRSAMNLLIRWSGLGDGGRWFGWGIILGLKTIKRVGNIIWGVEVVVADFEDEVGFDGVFGVFCWDAGDFGAGD